MSLRCIPGRATLFRKPAAAAADAAFGSPDEIDEHTDVGRQIRWSLQLINAVLQPFSGTENGFEGPLDSQDSGCVEAVSAHADEIDRANPADLVIDTERRDIFCGPGPAAHHGQFADPYKLMNQAVPGDDRTIPDFHMTSEQGTINQNDMVADAAVVRYVAVNHEEIMIADGGGSVLTIASVNGNAFAKDIVVANHGPGFFVMIADVLRGLADNGIGEYLIVFTQRCPASDMRAMHETGAGPDGDIGVDKDIGTDFDIFCQIDGGVDDCGWMDDGHSDSLRR